jgi:hypothetical protein
MCDCYLEIEKALLQFDSTACVGSQALIDPMNERLSLMSIRWSAFRPHSSAEKTTACLELRAWN